ncbi:MAG: preprotein translocase subunit YajC [Planctomycetaceae bacterium]|nr:preprotein translocase subunit YajC [Planctomycetaceae bacterium]
MSEFFVRGGLIAQQAGDPPGGLAMMFMPILMIVALYWMLIARPQKREMMAKADMLKSLKKNDHVLTVGGIYGVVTNVRPEANEVTLRVDETNNTRIKVTMTSIIRVTSGEEDAKTETKT